ncbi:MAG: isocitrate lyase/phosphoenolpyruvate mutase family protein [Acidimicrobiales bacterium]
MTDRHERFAELHRAGTFLIPNAGDAATAAIIELAGAVAIATSSGAHAASIGRSDAAGEVSRNECVERTAQIVHATSLPVSVDAEEGYGATPEDVADTVRLLADVGASGASIEDWSGDADRGFFSLDEATARVAAACEAARSLGHPFVITARTEAFLHPAAFPGGPTVEAVVERLASFASVGATCLYAPGDNRIDTLRRIVTETGGNVNALVPLQSQQTMEQLADAGVRRVSLGASLYRVALGHIRDTVGAMIETKTFDHGALPVSSAQLDELLHRY